MLYVVWLPQHYIGSNSEYTTVTNCRSVVVVRLSIVLPILFRYIDVCLSKAKASWRSERHYTRDDRAEACRPDRRMHHEARLHSPPLNTVDILFCSSRRVSYPVQDALDDPKNVDLLSIHGWDTGCWFISAVWWGMVEGGNACTFWVYAINMILLPIVFVPRTTETFRTMGCWRFQLILGAGAGSWSLGLYCLVFNWREIYEQSH